MALLVVGYQPGNAHAIAKRFGAEGYTVALVGREQEWKPASTAWTTFHPPRARARETKG